MSNIFLSKKFQYPKTRKHTAAEFDWLLHRIGMGIIIVILSSILEKPINIVQLILGIVHIASGLIRWFTIEPKNKSI